MKILCLFYDGGYGVTRASNLIFNAIKNEYKDTIKHLSNINNTYVIYDIIKNHNPDVIVTQDYFSWIMNAISCYKIDHHVKSILYSLYIDDIIPDGLETFDGFFVPENNSMKYSRNCVAAASSVFYLPLEPNFRYDIEWSKRENNFIYAGRIDRTKLNLKILSLLDKHHQTLHVYGAITDQKHFSKCRRFNSFKYMGVATTNMMPSIFNKYKFHILYSETDCFSISSLEAAACGTIPITIGRILKWMKDYSFQFSNIHEFSIMQPALLIHDLTKFSINISNKIDSNYRVAPFIEQFGRALKNPVKNIKPVIKSNFISHPQR